MVGHSIVEAKSTFHFFGLGYSCSDRIDCATQVLLSANATRVRVVHETVTLLVWIQVWLSYTWEKVKTLVVWLLGVFIYGVGLM